jgi:hypothetical protein
MNNIKNSLPALILAASCFSHIAQAEVLFEDDFNNVSGGGLNFPHTQYQSGLGLSVHLDFAGWTKEGTSHGVDVDNGSNLAVNDRNVAAMIWQGHTLTQSNAVLGSNLLDHQYDLGFLMSAAVYEDSQQFTTSLGGMWIELLRNDNSVVSQELFQPGAWTGDMDFSEANMQYTGDGTGDVRISIRYSPTNNRFSGAIDNISLQSVSSVNTPSSVAFIALGLIGFISRRTNKK